jgi:hypothetical protein
MTSTSNTFGQTAKPSSQPWVAGAVLGSVAVAALAGYFYHMWRLKNAGIADTGVTPLINFEGASPSPEIEYFAARLHMAYQQPYDRLLWSAAQNFHPAKQNGPAELGDELSRDPVEAPVESTSPRLSRSKGRLTEL